jgi:dipeptidyl aminopeptidase/acylaminoacyl peptidase
VKLLRAIFVISIVYLLSSTVVGYFLVEGAVHPFRKKLNEKSTKKANAIALRAHSKIQNVTINAGDHTKLKAWYFESPEPSSKTALLFHGLSDNRGGMVGYALFLLRDHYNVLVSDWRAHGESEGKFATYGLIETNDVKEWIDWLQKNGNQSFYALGESYGAAILLQSLAKEKRICAAVAESSFASFREAAYDRLGQPLGFSDKVGRTLFLPIAEAGLLTGSWKYQFDFEQVYPLQSLRASTTPVLLIHGDADTNLPVRHSRLMYSMNRNRPNLEYWESAGAEHSSTHGKYRAEFESRVLAWFHKHRCDSTLRHNGAK